MRSSAIKIYNGAESSIDEFGKGFEQDFGMCPF